MQGRVGDMEITIKLAYDELDNVRILFTQYAGMLRLNEEQYEHYQKELAVLPGRYALPGGRLYIAYGGEKLAGCVAIERVDETCCKLKRLYVRPEFRGMKIGAALMMKVIEDAAAMGCRQMVLGTMTWLETAVSLYKKMGFKETGSYNTPPEKDALYFSLSL